MRSSCRVTANADVDLSLPLGDSSGRRRRGVVGVRGAAMSIEISRLTQGQPKPYAPSIHNADVRRMTPPKLTHGQLAHEITLLRAIERETGIKAPVSIELVIQAWENGQ